MALPSSGALSFSQIRDEFNDTNPVRLSDLYRNGGLVPNAPANSNITTSGTQRVSNYYGATNEIVARVSFNSQRLNIASLFPTTWNQNVPKRVIIESGVVIGSSNPSDPAVTVPTGLRGQLTIDNFGSIQGAGGVRGLANGGNGGPGGNAVNTSSPVSINNRGTIYAGGGGGGAGGRGATNPCPGISNPPSCGNRCKYGCGNRNEPAGFSCPQCGGPPVNFGNGVFGWCCANYGCDDVAPTPVPSSAGGNGGNGGVGRGFNQADSDGLGGSNSTSSCRSGGRGGNGGDGGGWGQNGGDGAVNGGDGGARGRYVRRFSGATVTFINLGTVAGAPP